MWAWIAQSNGSINLFVSTQQTHERNITTTTTAIKKYSKSFGILNRWTRWWTYAFYELSSIEKREKFPKTEQYKVEKTVNVTDWRYVIVLFKLFMRAFSRLEIQIVRCK